MRAFLTSGGPLWAVAILLKGAAILTLAWLLTLTLRRSSAALRHLVWAAGLLAVLVLPLLSATLPWRLPVTLPQPVAIAPAARRAPPPVPAASIQPEGTSSGPAAPTPGLRAGTSAPQPGNSGWHLPAWPVLLLGLWVAGAVILLGRLLLGGLVVARVVRRAVALDGRDWTRPLMEGADRLELPRLPALLMSDRLPMPFACGILRPAIILPAGAEAWDSRRRRAVLCHELAHLRRLDLPVNLIGQIACALHWFNPLVWIAVRRVRIESERACDDLVLGAGTRASEYADHLLQIVCRAARSRPPAVVLPMAHRREFEGRMLAILERDARREPLTRWRAAGLAVMTLALVLPLAALAPSTAARQAQNAAAGMQTPVDSTRGLAASPADTGTVDSSVVTHSAMHLETNQKTHVRTEASSTTATGTKPMPVKVNGSFHVSLNGPFAARDTADPRVVAGLLHALEDSVPDVRANAAYALGQLEIRSTAAPLGARLQHEPVARVRSQIVWALGQIESPDAVPALTAVVRQDSSKEVRGMAVWALGQIEDSSAVPALVVALGDRAAEVRGKAAWALGQIEPRHAPPELIAALRDPAVEVRGQAAWALGQIEDTAAVAGLMQALGDSVTDVRRQALWALGRMESPATQPALLRALQDPDPEIRAAAAHALGNSGN